MHRKGTSQEQMCIVSLLCHVGSFVPIRGESLNMSIYCKNHEAVKIGEQSVITSVSKWISPFS